MIDGARPRHRVVGGVMLDQTLCDAKTRPAVFADRAVQWLREPLPAPGARRLE
jgi:hypothetical protein